MDGEEAMSMNPVAILCSSKADIESLVRISSALSEGMEFVLLLRDGRELRKRLLPAYLNAFMRMVEGGERAQSLQMEVLLFAAGTMRIDRAIERCGISDPGRFLAFSSSRVLASRFARKAGVRLVKEYRLSFDIDVAGSVASTGYDSESLA